MEKDMAIGMVKDQIGLVKKCDNCMVVMKEGVTGDEIKKHNHPGSDVFFIVLIGEVKVTLNDEEHHTVVPGQILCFDGANHISAEMLKDSKVCVVLADQNEK